MITLFALRAPVITTIYGRGGLSRSAETVHEDEPPAGPDAQQVEGCVLPLLADLISGHSAHFLARSALTAPVVLAGLGVAVHHTMPWAEPSKALGSDQLSRLLSGIRWERDARYWDGVAAKSGASGRLNFSGGVKDSGGRVADAIHYPGTEAGRQIRGQWLCGLLLLRREWPAAGRGKSAVSRRVLQPGEIPSGKGMSCPNISLCGTGSARVCVPPSAKPHRVDRHGSSDLGGMRRQ
ncbi:hypothetical protein [Streptomyces cyaneofuscatus]|uniref:hypothetical protein n=1 Tax=Streptomyces cyaneofuscatus TaxID=66883 RepID=UPI0037D63399